MNRTLIAIFPLSILTFLSTAGMAMAGAAPSPLPLAGALGPFGLVAAGAGYACYYAYRRFIR